MHRTYHMSRMPTFNKKVRVVLDWTLALFFRRDVVSLGALHHPHDDFDRAQPTGQFRRATGGRAAAARAYDEAAPVSQRQRKRP